MSELDELRGDLADEQTALDLIVRDLDDAGWSTPTPSPGWDVRDQIAHLTYFDGTAALAASDPDAFAEGVAALIDGAGAVGVDEFTLGAMRAVPPLEVLEMWRMNRARLDRAAAALAADARVPWYGPSMGAKSFLTARLMETWAHGQDIVDGLGISREPTGRLRHIARLGFITRGWSYSVRGEQVPDEPVHVELLSPSGELWEFGSSDAVSSVRGTAEDFCFVVTQRRHLADTGLVATGVAGEWMLKAQAFAGGPTQGPEPRARP
jgi:uncharacterized protein (TIGR03084 family)